jgi:hypothetical protein
LGALGAPDVPPQLTHHHLPSSCILKYKIENLQKNQVLDCAGKHQVLIFVHSRKETAKTALYLKQTALDNDHLAKFMRDDSASREILQVCVCVFWQGVEVSRCLCARVCVWWLPL